MNRVRSWAVLIEINSTLAWKIPWTEEPGRLQSMRSLGVGHDWATSLSLFTFMHWRRKWQPTPVFLPGESRGQVSLVGCHLGSHSRTRLKRLSSILKMVWRNEKLIAWRLFMKLLQEFKREVMKAWICIALVSMNKWSWTWEKLLRGNQENSQSYPSFQLWYLKWAPISINIITNTKKMLMLKLQYFGHLVQRANSLKETLILGKTEGKRRRGGRGWDG